MADREYWFVMWTYIPNGEPPVNGVSFISEHPGYLYYRTMAKSLPLALWRDVFTITNCYMIDEALYSKGRVYNRDAKLVCHNERDLKL